MSVIFPSTAIPLSTDTTTPHGQVYDNVPYNNLTPHPHQCPVCCSVWEHLDGACGVLPDPEINGEAQLPCPTCEQSRRWEDGDEGFDQR